MEAMAKRHPALTILAVALVLWLALGWWKRHKSALGPAATGGGGGGGASTPLQTLTSDLNSAQDTLSTYCVLNPTLCLLTPKTFRQAVSKGYNLAKNFLSSGTVSFDQSVQFNGGDGTIPYSAIFKAGTPTDIVGIPGNAQIDHNGDVTFDGTATGNYVAAWRAAGFQVYVDGNAITLKPTPAGTVLNLDAPPVAPPPRAA